MVHVADNKKTIMNILVQFWQQAPSLSLSVRRKEKLQHDILKRQTDLRFSAKPKQKDKTKQKKSENRPLARVAKLHQGHYESWSFDWFCQTLML